jgi:hypothetical protein
MPDNFTDPRPDPALPPDSQPKAAPVAAAQPQRSKWILTNYDYDDATLASKEKLTYAVAAVMILGPLFFGWSGIGR